LPSKGEHLNEILVNSIDATIPELFGPNVLSLHLKDNYDVTRDELPYRMQTMYSILSNVFGAKGERTIERQIAKHLTSEFNIPFKDTRDCTLPMYIEEAKAAVEVI